MQGQETATASDRKTLLDVPVGTSHRIDWEGQAVKDLGYYAVLGLRVGGFVRVLAR